MSKKFNNDQKEVFKRLVLDCILQRLTTEESLDYINTKLKGKYDVEIGSDFFRHIKMELKQDSRRELDHLRKNRFAYMNHLFFERVDEIKNMQRKLWQIITDNVADKPDIAIRSIAGLHKLSNSLCQVYEMLPVLGRLPSDSFADIVNEDDNAAVAEEGSSSSSSSSVEGEIPPSTFGSSGVYHIDKFNNKQI
jgi:hypothetical protein